MVNETKQFTSADITDFLKMMIEVGDVYSVTEEAMVVEKDTGNPVLLIDAQGTASPLSVYYADQKKPGTIIINPFAEGIASSREIEWFYLGRAQAIAKILIRIMNRMMVLTLPENADTEEIKSLSAEQLALLSPFAEKCDKKMLEELHLLAKSPINFFNLRYAPRKATVTARLGLFEESTRSEYKKLRKKSWTVLIDMAAAILGTDKLEEEYSATSTQCGCGRLFAFSQVFAKLIKQLMPYWDFSQLTRPDLKKLIQHVSMIPLYYTRAKNLITPILAEQKSAGSTGTVPWVGAYSANPNANQFMTNPGQLVAPMVSPAPVMMPVQQQPAIVSAQDMAAAVAVQSQFGYAPQYSVPQVQQYPYMQQQQNVPMSGQILSAEQVQFLQNQQMYAGNPNQVTYSAMGIPIVEDRTKKNIGPNL